MEGRHIGASQTKGGSSSPAGQIYFLAAFCLLMRAYGRQPLMLSMSPMWACKSSAMQLRPGLFGVLCLEGEVHLYGGRNAEQTGQETRHDPVPRAGHCAVRSGQQYGHDPAGLWTAARLPKHKRQDVEHTSSPNRRSLRSSLHNRVSRRWEPAHVQTAPGPLFNPQAPQRDKLLHKHSMSLAWHHPQGLTACSLPSLLSRFELIFSLMCCLPGWRIITLPPAVTLNRLAAACSGAKRGVRCCT